MYRILSAVAAAALTAGTVAVASPAHAAPAEDSVTISLAGLNPADPADSDQIERRIRNAARDLCGSDLIQPARLRARAVACEKSAVANARNDVQLAAAKQGAPFRLALRTR
ncbi:MAG TPA: UrcA family protein [Allosphingosinicella sp.]|nr:UrcA family protein [Allosphingosinicella sp.]